MSSSFHQYKFFEIRNFFLTFFLYIMHSFKRAEKGGAPMYELSWNPMADLEDLIYETRQLTPSER